MNTAVMNEMHIFKSTFCVCVVGVGGKVPLRKRKTMNLASDYSQFKGFGG